MTVVYVREFLEDVGSAVRWLEDTHPEWLRQFGLELEELEMALDRHSEIGVRIEAERRTARKFFFRKAPYVIWYDEPEPGLVRLLRLFHGHARRPPERKPRRKRREH